MFTVKGAARQRSSGYFPQELVLETLERTSAIEGELTHTGSEPLLGWISAAMSKRKSKRNLFAALETSRGKG